MQLSSNCEVIGWCIDGKSHCIPIPLLSSGFFFGFFGFFGFFQDNLYLAKILEGTVLILIWTVNTATRTSTRPRKNETIGFSALRLYLHDVGQVRRSLMISQGHLKSQVVDGFLLNKAVGDFARMPPFPPRVETPRDARLAASRPVRKPNFFVQRSLHWLVSAAYKPGHEAYLF